MNDFSTKVGQSNSEAIADGIDAFVQAILKTADKPRDDAQCRHGVPSDYLCDICEGNTAPAKVFKFPVPLGFGRGAGLDLGGGDET